MIEQYTYLYVEDDPMSREALKLLLTRVIGVERLYIFEDSTDFMTRLKALPHTPDLIMLDIHMQPYDGFDMLTMLRQDPLFEKTCVIALTASVMNEEVKLLKERGFDGGIGKPIEVSSFRTLIERIFEGEQVWHITSN
jgi:CheY-like chemotaxis protein